MLCIDVCTFVGEVTSSSLALMGKNFHLKLAARIQAGSGAVSLVPVMAQWSLCKTPSAEVDIDLGVFSAKELRGPEVAVATRLIGILRGEDHWGPSVFLFSLGRKF